MHPYRAAKVFLGCTEVGVIAECNPQFTKDLKGRVVLCELECDTLLELKTSRKYAPTSKFPTSLFEISVVAPVKDHYSAILKLLTDGVPKDQLRVIDLLDVYQGKPLPEDKKSVSVRVVFGAQDRTLTGEELTKLQDNLMAHIEKNSYAIRR
jgi:phenylalanyl-tRNA synthetase beta chain